MLVTHSWLKEYIGEDIKTTEEIVKLLMTHSFEVEGSETVFGEEVIDIDILPNRASDSLSHRGIAREIVTLTGTQLNYDPLTESIDLPTTEKITINIDEPSACRRFGMALVNGVTIKESPDWLKKRIEAIGQRSINNVVDATNYVMFSIGQPIHAYDAKKFPQQDGVWKFGVRFAREDEKITVLTGEEYSLDESVQLIVDESNDAGAGIAGIKGGNYAEIDNETTDIIIEAANFDPAVTRKASQKLRLQTDASKRFENEPSRDIVPYALNEAVKLIIKIGGGECDGYVDEFPTPHTNPKVPVELSHINAHLGLELQKEEVQKIFDRLGFSTKEENKKFLVTAPFERTDINIAEDVIEEVGRIYGYDHIESIVPDTVLLEEYNKRHYYSEKIRSVLIDAGYSEIITSSFRKKDIIKLRNALASDKEYMRSSLNENIKEALDRNILNIELLNINAVRLFEVGTVFDKTADGNDVAEHFSLALGVRAKKQGYVPKDDSELSEILSKLKDDLGLEFDSEIKNGILEINLSKALESAQDTREYEKIDFKEEIAYKPYSAFPYISRDLALWVPDSIDPEEVESLIKEKAGEVLLQTTLFDEFKKEGKVSYGFRLIFQSMERTLTDDEVGKVIAVVSKALEDKGYELR